MGEYGVSKSILIVESHNDKYFFEALLDHLAINDVAVGAPICRINDYECLGGIDNLKACLIELKERIEKDDIQRVGIILDADNKGVVSRISLINESLKTICLDINLNSINSFEKSAELDVEFACCITHVDGSGELETLLKTIKSEESTHADCLQEWKKCVEESGKTIKQKDFDKFWISIYQRYDTCKNAEKGQVDRKCNTEASMKKPIWNFEHTVLNDLKAFLKLFKD